MLPGGSVSARAATMSDVFPSVTRLRAEPRMAPYSEIAEPLGDLLREFRPPRKAVHPSFPFWRLRADGVWAIDGAAQVASPFG